MNETRDAAVDHYKVRAALLFSLWPTPDMNETLRIETAYRILSRAIEAEMFGDPKVHHDLDVDSAISIW